MGISKVGNKNINIVDAYTGTPAEVEKNGGLAVNIQDQTSKPIDVFFSQSISNFTLSTDNIESGVSSLVYTFEATGGHGIVSGNEIILLDVVADRFFYAEVKNVVTNTITVDRPIDHIFAAVSTLGRIVTTQMAVDGGSTEQIFSLRAGSVPLDFTRIIFSMLCDSALDDGKFGNITKLNRGIVFRIVNSFQKTIFNFKTNGEIAQFCFDLKYSDKAPAGNEGMTARITFAGQSKHGVTLRISENDVIQWVIQDDLTDLVSFRIAAQGHEVIQGAGLPSGKKIESYDLNPGEWSRISNAGESGSVWQKNKEGNTTIYISHTAQEGADTIPIESTVNMDLGKSAELPNDAQSLLMLDADSEDDVFYATIIGTDGDVLTDMK